MDSLIEFREVTNTHHPDFEEIVRIFQTSFPPEEQFPAEVFARRVQQKRDRAFAGYYNGTVALMAMLHPLPDSDLVLLGYLATDAPYRGRGIGTQFVRYILERLQQNQQYLLLELDHPEYGDDRELRQRRVEFYRRLGAVELKNVRYVLPPLTGDKTTEMILAIAPGYQSKRLSGEQVKKIIADLHIEAYDRDSNDPLLQSLLDEVENSVELV